MILTGKAKEDFKEFLYNKYDVLYELKDYHKTMLYAEIIEWFDSVEIYIEVIKEGFGFAFNLHKGNWKNPIERIGYWEIRNEATEQAIKKANEIYNEM